MPRPLWETVRQSLKTKTEGALVIWPSNYILGDLSQRNETQVPTNLHGSFIHKNPKQQAIQAPFRDGCWTDPAPPPCGTAGSQRTDELLGANSFEGS